MNGYKTGGNWTDVTSFGRNEVVFEGRHKAYGAYYIRQRYSNSLLFSLLSAVSFIAVCAFIPYIMRNTKQPPPPPPDNSEKVTPYIVPVTPKDKPHPPIPPRVDPPPAPTTSSSAPPIVSTVVTPDTAHKPVNENPVVPISGPVTPGTGSTPPTTGGGEESPFPIVPRRDTFVLYAGTMPKFLHGDINTYLANQINYPADESQRGVQGTVYASFIIEKDGSVSNVTLKRGVPNGPNLNKEALRVLSEMPPWSPAKQDGHPVRIQFTVPISFKLR